ncbi:MAG: 2-C-methyl-D-erythritol 4-phosphate cytidylyltransferase [Bacteroidia bacterium]|nr:2-C-methyl-D-erythritol 4-phosphate cytidylyltransferase [Bacteroidia bacterium]
MKKNVIIVAGGTGTRMKSDIPKQFHLLCGQPMIFRTINTFFKYDNSIKIIISIPKNFRNYWDIILKQYHFNITVILADGGKTRFHSVKNALKQIDDEALIAVHDAVRPLIDIATISRCFETAAMKGTAIPVIDINDSMRIFEGTKSRPVQRKKFKLVQTPQVFQSNIIASAYLQNYNPAFTDDANVVEAAGYKIFFVEGNPLNIKITISQDLKLAEALT